MPSQDKGCGAWCLPVGLEEVTSACLWISKWWQSLVLAPRSSCRQCPVAWEHSQGKKLFWWSHPSPHAPPNNGALPLWWA